MTAAKLNTPRSSAFTQYPLITPLIVAALPAPETGGLSALDIFAAVRFSTVACIRRILWTLDRDGISVSELVPCRRGHQMRLYRLAPTAERRAA